MAAGPTTLTLVVGSGQIGFADGDASTASFIEPIGVTAFQSAVYVADAGAQRIRMISSTGNVTTVAGSGALGDSGLGVTGGFRNGPALQAQFNHPSAIVVDRDGSLVVADTRNHCLRRISHDLVTTIAGSPNRSSGGDGPALEASLHDPRGIVESPDGTIYIADHDVGLRKLEPNGTLTTVPIPIISRDIVSVSLSLDADAPLLFATNGTQTIQVNLKSSAWRLWSANRDERGEFGVQAELEGGIGTGHPVGIAALAPDEIVYADPETNTVRYLHDKYQTTLSPESSVEQPTGVAVMRDGRIVVANTGQRRISFFAGPDRRSWHHPTPLPDAKSSRVFRIAYVGNSYIYYDTSWLNSIPGSLESQLNQEAATLGIKKRVEVYPIRFGQFDALAQYSNEILSSGLFDAVILQLNSHFLVSTYGVEPWSPIAGSEPKWKTKFTKDFASFIKPLRDARVPLAVLVHPEASEVGPEEAIVAFEVSKGNGITVDDFASSLREIPSIAQGLGVSCTMDSSPDFIAAEKSATRTPLFGPKDWHLTSAGRDILSRDAIKLLESCEPWKGTP